MKNILVCGAGGFIGNHLVTQLKTEDNYIIGVDRKNPEYSNSDADRFIIGDLRDPVFVKEVFLGEERFDEVYQLAAELGGAEYVFTGENDYTIMSNSARININIIENCIRYNIPRVFYSSSACIYPEHNQLNPDDPNCEESSAYPANPDSEYGWEKLFSERLYLSASRNKNLEVRIARFHNIFGPLGNYKGGREKAPAALCRKVSEAEDGTEIEIFGDGNQTRSFLYISCAVEGIIKLMRSDVKEPLNIGSEEMVTINELAEMIIKYSGKDLKLKHIEGPLGVRGRNSHNKLIKEKLNWEPVYPLEDGIKKTYNWINNQINLFGS